MKLLLINPEVSNPAVDRVYFVPTAVLGLATLVKSKGIEVSLLDLNVIKYKRNTSCSKAVIDAVQSFNPDLVGIGCVFSGQFKSVIKYSKHIKRIRPTLSIVIGGMHPTLFHKQILENCPSIDYISISEGEAALLALIRYMNKEIPIESIPSFAYRNETGVTANLHRETIMDVNILPIPDYSLINIKDYYHEETSTWHNPKNLPINASLPLLTSRGCPFDCNFCCLYEIMGRKMRYRDPMLVVDEIEMLYKTYNHTHFSFMDDNLVIKKKHIINVCNEIVRRNLNIQFDTVNGVAVNFIDAEVLAALCAAGMTRLSLPIEHGSDYMRNQIIKKKLTDEKIYEVVDMTKKYKDIMVRAFFIIGFPEETAETLEATYNMIQRIDVDRPIVNNLMPYAGTDLFKQCAKDNLFVDNINLDDMWTVGNLNFAGNRKFFIKPYNMSIKELLHFRERFDALTTTIIERKKNERQIIKQSTAVS